MNRYLVFNAISAISHFTRWFILLQSIFLLVWSITSIKALRSFISSRQHVWDGLGPRALDSSTFKILFNIVFISKPTIRWKHLVSNSLCKIIIVLFWLISFSDWCCDSVKCNFTYVSILANCLLFLLCNTLYYCPTLHYCLRTFQKLSQVRLPCRNDRIKTFHTSNGHFFAIVIRNHSIFLVSLTKLSWWN